MKTSRYPFYQFLSSVLLLFSLGILAQPAFGQHNGCDAHFTYGPLSSSANSIHFSPALNAAGATYTWNFGDGTAPSHALDPIHVYPHAGAYYVCLIVSTPATSGSPACTTDFCDSVHVYGTHTTCNANFSYRPTNAGDSIQFNPVQQNTPNTTYAWNFGDGTNSNALSPVHFYPPGAYFVCLIVTQSDANGNVICTVDHCDSVHVYPPHTGCDAHFTYNPLSSNANSIHFNPAQNPAGASYEWHFGDGSAASTALSPTHVYNHPGAYYVCLTVTVQASAGSAACTSTWCDSVHVIAQPPHCNPNFTFFTTNFGDSVHFVPQANPPGTSYTWHFGDGSSSTNQSPVHFYPPGAYNVCLIVTQTDANGAVVCTADHCDSIHVFPPHYNCNARYSVFQLHNTDSMHFYPSQTAPGTSYAWNFGDGGTSTLQSPTHGYATPGTYWVCLDVTLTNSAGTVLCTDHRCDSIRVSVPPPPPPPCDARFRYIGGVGQNNVFFIPAMSIPGTTYSWDFGDGATSTQGYTVHQYPQPGAYWACLTVTRVDSLGNFICTTTWCDSVRTQRRRLFPPPNHFPWPPFSALEPSEGNSPEQADKLSSNDLSGAIKATAEIYPNPITPGSVLRLQNSNGNVTIRVYDNVGRIVTQKDNLENGEIQLNFENYIQGLYFYSVMDTNGIIGSGKLIVQ